MRWLLLITFLFLATPETGAQIYVLQFKDAKTSKKYKRLLTPVPGGYGVVCELKSGVSVDRSGGNFNITWNQKDRCEFYIRVGKDPSSLPYRVINGEVVPAGKSGILAVQGDRIGKLSVMAARDSFYSLSLEFAYREDQIERLEAQRDECEKGTTAWFRLHQQATHAREQLRVWLESYGYLKAAKAVEKQIAKDSRVTAKEGADARLQRALDSIRAVKTPELLVSAAEEISKGRVKFKVMESQHMRVVYFDGIEEGRIERLLAFSEKWIEGFRNRFVDPYLAEDYPDWIPDEMFVEYYFGPDNVRAQERYFTDYYLQSWGPKKEERLKSTGQSAHRGGGPHFLNYWRYHEGAHLRAIVAHTLGHALGQLHYGGCRLTGDRARCGLAVPQDWLWEGAGYWLSFEAFGRNEVTCKQINIPEEAYVREKKEKTQGEKTVMVGLRDFYTKLALDKGRPLEWMSPMTLYELEDGDLAKSWALFLWVAQELGKEGQMWLRACCASAAGDPNKFIPTWRKVSEPLFDATGKDVFAVIEEEWRQFVEGERATQSR